MLVGGNSGAWHLHRISLGLTLEVVVLFVVVDFLIPVPIPSSPGVKVVSIV